MYGPLNTAGVSSVQLFLDQNNKSLQDIPNVTLLQFKAQIPSNENQGSTKKGMLKRTVCKKSEFLQFVCFKHMGTLYLSKTTQNRKTTSVFPSCVHG